MMPATRNGIISFLGRNLSTALQHKYIAMTPSNIDSKFLGNDNCKDTFCSSVSIGLS